MSTITSNMRRAVKHAASGQTCGEPGKPHPRYIPEFRRTRGFHLRPSQWLHAQKDESGSYNYRFKERNDKRHGIRCKNRHVKRRKREKHAISTSKWVHTLDFVVRSSLFQLKTKKKWPIKHELQNKVITQTSATALLDIIQTNSDSEEDRLLARWDPPQRR